MGKLTADSQQPTVKNQKVEELNSSRVQEKRTDNAEAQRARSYAEKRNPRAQSGMAVLRVAEFNGGVT